MYFHETTQRNIPENSSSYSRPWGAEVSHSYRVSYNCVWQLVWFCRQVLRPPRYGALHPSSSQKHHRLQSGDIFTQQDLDAGRLRYRLHRKAYSHVHDEVTFRVSAPECVSVPGTLGLVHIPSGETRDEVRATLERLQVRETYCAQITSWSLRSVNVLSAVRGKYKACKWTEDFPLVSDSLTANIGQFGFWRMSYEFIIMFKMTAVMTKVLVICLPPWKVSRN
jgi:hypothetical protein